MVTCWDAAKMVLDEATARFSPAYRENPEKKGILQEYCKAIGEIAGRAGSTFYYTSVDPDTQRISVSLDVTELEVHGSAVRKDGRRDLPLADLIDRSIVFRIRTDEETGHPMMVFTFPGVWDKV